MSRRPFACILTLAAAVLASCRRYVANPGVREPESEPVFGLSRAYSHRIGRERSRERSLPVKPTLQRSSTLPTSKVSAKLWQAKAYADHIGELLLEQSFAEPEQKSSAYHSPRLQSHADPPLPQMAPAETVSNGGKKVATEWSRLKGKSDHGAEPKQKSSVHHSLLQHSPLQQSHADPPLAQMAPAEIASNGGKKVATERARFKGKSDHRTRTSRSGSIKDFGSNEVREMPQIVPAEPQRPIIRRSESIDDSGSSEKSVSFAKQGRFVRIRTHLGMSSSEVPAQATRHPMYNATTTSKWANAVAALGSSLVAGSLGMSSSLLNVVVGSLGSVYSLSNFRSLETISSSTVGLTLTLLVSLCCLCNARPKRRTPATDVAKKTQEAKRKPHHDSPKAQAQGVRPTVVQEYAHPAVVQWHEHPANREEHRRLALTQEYTRPAITDGRGLGLGSSSSSSSAPLWHTRPVLTHGDFGFDSSNQTSPLLAVASVLTPLVPAAAQSGLEISSSVERPPQRRLTVEAPEVRRSMNDILLHADSFGESSASASAALRTRTASRPVVMKLPLSYKAHVALSETESFDSEGRISELPMLSLESGEAIVRVAYASVAGRCQPFKASGNVPDGADSFALGAEGVGTVVAVADDVLAVEVGDAVCFVGSQNLAEYIKGNAAMMWKVSVASPASAALRFSALTASVMVEETAMVSADESVLVTAAAGGVAHFLVQFAKFAGALVIGTCSTDLQRNALRELGCDYIVNHETQDVDVALRRLCPGGCDVVFDCIGGDMFEIALRNLARGGRMLQVGYESEFPRRSAEDSSDDELIASLFWEVQARTTNGGTIYGNAWPRLGIWLAGSEPVVSRYDAGELLTLVDGAEKFVGLETVGEAVEHALARETVGRVIVKVSDEA